MSPRRANPDAHEALVEAARDEFARSGVDGARVEDIARRAGVSKGAFYLHFRTKEAVFREILQRFLGVLADLALRREDMICAVGARTANLREVLARECASDAELLEALWRHRKIVAALDRAAGGRVHPERGRADRVGRRSDANRRNRRISVMQLLDRAGRAAEDDVGVCRLGLREELRERQVHK